MTTPVTAAAALLFLSVVTFCRAEDWIVKGKEYHNVKVANVENDTVALSYDGGAGRFDFADLSPELQKRFHYDPKEEAKIIPFTPSEEGALSKEMKASLLFSVSPNRPNQLRVYLRLVNQTDYQIGWYGGIDGQLFDSRCHPVPQAFISAVDRAESVPGIYTLPGESRLDWLISEDWLTAGKEAPSGNFYSLQLGMRLWYVPVDTVSTYFVRIRLNGRAAIPSTRAPDLRRPVETLIETDPQKIVLPP